MVFHFCGVNNCHPPVENTHMVNNLKINVFSVIIEGQNETCAKRKHNLSEAIIVATGKVKRTNCYGKTNSKHIMK